MTSKDKAPKRGHRLYLPIGIAVLAAGGMALVQAQSELERNMKSWFSLAILVLAGLLGVVWWVLLSRFRWRTRLLAVAVLALAWWAFPRLTRVEGTMDGRGLPRLVWRWSETVKRAPLVVARPAQGTTNAAAVAAAEVEVVPGAVDVPQFFGPARDGVVRGAGLDPNWTAHAPRELWRQPAGGAWSAFAVAGGRVFTQEQAGEDELVTCYDLLTGRSRWAHTNHVRFFQWQGGEGPRATPTVDQGRVFAYGATGVLDCLEAATGKRLWTRDVLAENHLGNLTWGVSCSPLVFGDTVVVTGGATRGANLLAYRRDSGLPVWKAGSDKASYASPILATLAGVKVVLSVNATSFTAHDPATGKVLLDYEWSTEKWPKAAQPVVVGPDRVFLTAGYGVGCQLIEVKAAADGMLTATEVWKNMHMKAQFNSVAVRDGYLYGLDDGLLACVEIATGDRKWKDGRYGSGQTLLVDDLVIVQTEPGPVVLAAAKPEGFAELGRLPALKAKTWNHPTLAGRYLLVRNSEEMACYELPVKAAPAVAAGL